MDRTLWSSGLPLVSELKFHSQWCSGNLAPCEGPKCGPCWALKPAPPSSPSVPPPFSYKYPLLHCGPQKPGVRWRFVATWRVCQETFPKSVRFRMKGLTTSAMLRVVCLCVRAHMCKRDASYCRIGRAVKEAVLLGIPGHGCGGWRQNRAAGRCHASSGRKSHFWTWYLIALNDTGRTRGRVPGRRPSLLHGHTHPFLLSLRS